MTEGAVTDPAASAQVQQRRRAPVTLRGLVTAIVFGGFALAVVLAKFTIPMAGTGIVTDPREVFTTLGAALSGPIGGVVIGFLAGVAEPDGIYGASLIAHISGGVWMGLAYKKLVYERLSMPRLLVGWAACVLAYYCVFALPGFLIGMSWLYPDVFAESYGAGTSLLQAYRTLFVRAAPEAVFTTLLTTLVILALPSKHRQPLW
jgi:hypothetical protein